MGQPTTIQGYEPEWAIIANHLAQHGSMTLDLKDRRAAAKLRFRFYGFRKAMVKHDPANPWIAVLMETQATITPEGDVHLERSPYAAVLRGLLEHSHILPPAAPQEQASPLNDVVVVHGGEHDRTILDVLTKKDKSAG